jgi:subfamily B ATP-binding cassette protein HlyB/CyaB
MNLFWVQGGFISPHSTESTGLVDTGVSCLTLIARLYGLAADPAQLRHEYVQTGQVFGEAEILRAAKQLDLKAKAVRADWQTLLGTALPAIATLHDGSFIVIARLDQDRLLIQDPRESRPTMLARESFAEAWSGRLILVTKRAHLRPEDRKFDFSWFIPAIVKHRKLLGEVLLAAFFLQIFALVTPLFFQVVIDKVLVHKATTTLEVIAVGMLIITAFEAILGGLRS